MVTVYAYVVREAVTHCEVPSLFARIPPGDQMKHCVLQATLASITLSLSAFAQTAAPSVSILLPERTRLLRGQLIDLVIEVRNANAVSNLKVTAGDVDLTSKFAAPARATLDCDTSSD